MTTPSICPKCGATIPDGAPQGLCPKCVLLGAATEIQSVARPSKAAAPPAVAELAVHFPDLEVLELIGAGGMGAVYKARQPKLDRLVALKVLSSDLAGDPAFAERFDREARLLARLNHPNIVTVFDSGVAGPFAYLMMEFVDGVNLRQAMKAGRFTPPEALALVQDICAALKFAHEQGILHRDIKPENILIDSRGQVKIADFGIAKLTGEEGQDLLTLTHRGFVLGSPHYMAPEQFESPGDVDQRADIYSLGVVLYELLTGELPLGRFAPPSKKSAVDARIDEIVMRTLERERELRFQTVGEVKTQVQAATTAKVEELDRRTSDEPNQSDGVSSKETARFATASAILTGISLAMVAFGLVWFSLMRDMVRQHPRSAMLIEPNYTFVVVCITAVAFIPAILGLLFGVKALKAVRESGGRKRGFIRALFGAVSWPVVLVLNLIVFIIEEILDRSVARSLSAEVESVIYVIVGVFAAIYIHRHIRSWAMEGGTLLRLRRQLGVAAALMMPLLILPQFFAPSVRYKFDGEESGLVAVPVPGAQPVPWFTGRPELNTTATVGAGMVVTFNYVLAKPDGGERSLKSNLCVIAPDRKSLTVNLRSGTNTMEVTDDGPVWQFGTECQQPAGEAAFSGQRITGAWQFERLADEPLQLTRHETQRIKLARRHPTGDPSGNTLETLYLEIITVPRTETLKGMAVNTRPIDLKDGLIGIGHPAKMISDWLEKAGQ